MLLGPSIIDLASSGVRAAAVNIYDANGNILTTLSGAAPATATLSTVAASTSSVTILAANVNRKQAIIVNNGTKNLFLAFSATASATAFTIELAAGNSYISPLNGYTGIITGIWSAANGNAQVTEVTP